jgi:hypothetical protein
MKICFSQIRGEYELMRKNFRSNDCTIRLSGGMKKRGYSEHDLDISVTMKKKKKPQELEDLCEKWNKSLFREFGLTLDCTIQTKDGNHVYDFDHRCGICDAEAPVDLTDGLKKIDGKWVKIESRWLANRSITATK